jgi:outer membrane protein OmpA-like peptidoglycan-associated protein
MEQKKQKTIDELFRSKLSNFELSQNGSNWSLVNHLIKEQARKKAVLFRLRLLFSSLAVIGVVSLFIFKPWSNFNTLSQLNSNEKIENSTKFSAPSFNEKANVEEIFSEQNTLTTQINKNNTTRPFATSATFSKKENTELIAFDNHQDRKDAEEVDLNASEITTANVIISTTKPLSENINYIESSSNTEYVYFGKDTLKATISNIGAAINSPFSDYAPVINADGSKMYFTSRRPVTEKEKKKGKASTENIYYSSFDAKKQKWTEAKSLPSAINQPKRFNSVIAISNDAQRMLIYRDDKYGNGDIYESVLYGSIWSEPEKLPEPINSKYMESSASISPDGKTIYFVSNRPGGSGGLDVWYCTKNQQGNWGEEKNIGTTINSSSGEEGVFIHPDGKTLYFSSKGHKGLGGYDIFYSRMENNKWTTPKNLGENINTSDDDVYFVMEANGKTGYYSSIKKGGLGEKDIYKVTFLSPKDKVDKGPLLTLFKGLVIDKENNQPITSDIEIIDLEKNEVISTFISNATTGSFLVSLPSGKNYGINVKKEGYLFYSDNVDISAAATYKEIIKTVLLEKIKIGSKIILKNIFYDYDKSTLRNASISELERLYKLITENPKLKIELSSHTDSRGSDVYNNKLSQERAQACVDYLLKKGVPKEKIIAKGYGKQQLLINDEEINQLKTEKEKEAAHQQNRRSEIKILEN